MAKLEWLEDVHKWNLITDKKEIKKCRLCDKQIETQDVVYFYPDRGLFWCSRECVIQEKHRNIDKFFDEVNIFKCFLEVRQ